MASLDLRQKRINATKGWFKTDIAREFKDKPYPLTEDEAYHICEAILRVDAYKVPNEYKSLLRYRDSALVAILWLFFKRANEVLGIKMSDISFENLKLNIAFSIQKKVKRFKVCPKCKERSSLDSGYCKKCSNPLGEDTIKTKEASSPKRVIKRKIATNRFVSFIQTWYNERLKLGKEGYLFPPLHVLRDGKGYGFDINRKMCTTTLWKILKRYSPALCPHLFRYAGTKWLLKVTQGRIRLVQKAGDWSSPAPIENYAHSIGETEEDIEFEKL